MKISQLAHDDGYLDISLDVDIYKSPDTGEYKLFISQDSAREVSYDVPYDISTTDDIAKYIKEYLETHCVKKE